MTALIIKPRHVANNRGHTAKPAAAQKLLDATSTPTGKATPWHSPRLRSTSLFSMPILAEAAPAFQFLIIAGLALGLVAVLVAVVACFRSKGSKKAEGGSSGEDASTDAPTKQETEPPTQP